MDLLVLRPLSLVGTVLGTAVFIVGLPFEAMSGDVAGPAKIDSSGTARQVHLHAPAGRHRQPQLGPRA